MLTACCWDLGECADGEEEAESNNHDDPTVVTATGSAGLFAAHTIYSRMVSTNQAIAVQ